MKIASVMTTSSRGGAEYAAVELLDALARRGHEVVMISDQPAIGRDRAVRVAPIAIGPKLATKTWRSLTLQAPVLLRQLTGVLRSEAPYDVLLLHYKKEQMLAPWLPTDLRPMLAWSEWGPVPYPVRRGVPRRLYLHAAHKADLIMAISQGTKDSLSAVGVDVEHVAVVPNAMRTQDIAFTSPGRERVRGALDIPADAFVVGCISRFHPKKRNDVVVDAVARLGDPRVHLLMAGEGETEAQLRAAATTTLNGRSHFIPTPGDEVSDVLSALDVSVFCPSPTEGQPRAVILGMLAGRPCLATGPEGVADLITPDVGTIATPENQAGALAEVLRSYVDDPDRCRREGEAARRRAEAVYAAPVVAEAVERLFHDAMDGAR